MNVTREDLVNQIFSIMPIMHKKFFHGMKLRKSMHKLQLLGAIMKYDGKPMKYYGDLLFVSKPNMTKMVNRLIEDGYVIRKNDEEDRRVIKIYITEDGKDYMKEHREEMKKKMLERIAGLSQEDMDALSYHFKELDKIFNKLNI